MSVSKKKKASKIATLKTIASSDWTEASSFARAIRSNSKFSLRQIFAESLASTSNDFQKWRPFKFGGGFVVSDKWHGETFCQIVREQSNGDAAVARLAPKVEKKLNGSFWDERIPSKNWSFNLAVQIPHFT